MVMRYAQGLVGTNGIGKSTALKILANKLKPNLVRLLRACQRMKYHLYSRSDFRSNRFDSIPNRFYSVRSVLILLKSPYCCAAPLTEGLFVAQGDFNEPPAWEAVLAYYRGSELQNYFTRLLEYSLKVEFVFLHGL